MTFETLQTPYQTDTETKRQKQDLLFLFYSSSKLIIYIFISDYSIACATIFVVSWVVVAGNVVLHTAVESPIKIIQLLLFLLLLSLALLLQYDQGDCNHNNNSDDSSTDDCIEGCARRTDLFVKKSNRLFHDSRKPFLDVWICFVHWTDEFCPTLRRLQLGNQPKPSEAFQFWISSFCMKIAHKRRLCKDTGKQGCLVRVCSDVCIAHCAIKCKKNKGNIQKDRQTDKCNKQVIEGNNQKKKCNKKY